MKKTSLFPAALTALGLTVSADALAPVRKITPDFSVTFATKLAEGRFEELKGTIAFDPADVATSKFNVLVPVASINTGNGLKNRHAKGENWFDAQKYPDIRFASTRVVKTAAGFQANGVLTMHGVTKEVGLPFTFTQTATGGVFIGHLEVKRTDFNIGDSGWVGDLIEINLKVPVVN